MGASPQRWVSECEWYLSLSILSGDGSDQSDQALNKEFVENAVQLLVTRFIPLNPLDLEEWVSDPEGWVNLEEQDNEQWVFETRVCSFTLLMVYLTLRSTIAMRGTSAHDPR